MALCLPCRKWMVGLLRGGLYKALILLDSPCDTPAPLPKLHLQLPDCERDVTEFMRNRLSCWFCSRFYCLLSVNIQEFLSTFQVMDVLGRKIQSRYATISASLFLSTRPGNANDGPNEAKIESARHYEGYKLLITLDKPYSGTGSIAFDICERDSNRSELTVVVSKQDIEAESSAELETEILPLSYEDMIENEIGALNPSMKTRTAQMKVWINACEHSHVGCRDAINYSAIHRPLPSRLLRLSKDGLTIQVVPTDLVFCSGRLKYATLSHCWGLKPLVRLTTETFDRYTHPFRISELGRTFKEALLLCHSLDIEYLWIDSLCIIQDSDSDWTSEAAKMHDIYGGSFLNIAATASTMCSQGLFRPKLDMVQKSLQIDLPNGLSLMYDGDSDSASDLRGHMMGITYLRSPLLTRGWVLQECFLAPRVIHWTDSQIFWQCYTHLCAEIANPVPIFKTTDRAEELFLYNVDPMAARVAEDLDVIWERVVCDFSQSRVTKRRDKYFALSGVASLMQERYKSFGINTKLIAGCWEHNITRWLCWARYISDRPPKAKSAEVFFPSWSWLKMKDDRVTIRRQYGPRMNWSLFQMKVLEMKVEYKHPTLSFGPIVSSLMEIEAMVFNAPRSSSLWTFESAHFCMKFHLTVSEDNDGRLSLSTTNSVTMFGDSKYLLDEQVDMDSIHNIRFAVMGIRNNGITLTIVGMVLVPHRGNEEQTVFYKRISEFHQNISIEGEGEFEKIQAKFREGKITMQSMTLL